MSANIGANFNRFFPGLTVLPKMTAELTGADGGSFRDPAARVYVSGDGRVFRGLGKEAASYLETLLSEPFFKQWMETGKVVRTSPAPPEREREIVSQGWSRAFEHEAVPFVSYPYEWTFSMLKDAALLQLDLLAGAMSGGWTFKDATPYNIQWVGSRPVFIDTASIVPRERGEPWLAYRQFCMLFLYPLMLKSHLGIDFNPILRAELDGITPPKAAAYFRGWKAFLPSVILHVLFPAMAENRIARAERDGAEAKKRVAKPRSEVVAAGLVDGVRRVVEGLKSPVRHSDWSHYSDTHSYEDDELEKKTAFVRRHACRVRRKTVWDLGANTGVFSRVCSESADLVVALDSDVDAVERLYLSPGGDNILPLVMNVANMSPGQGWAGKERKAFDMRGKPDLILGLALIHHLRVSAGLPVPLFLDWARSLECPMIVEFVGREDEMFVKMMANRKEKFEDYNQESFEKSLNERFKVSDSETLKGGKRKIYYVEPV